MQWVVSLFDMEPMPPFEVISLSYGIESLLKLEGML